MLQANALPSHAARTGPSRTRAVGWILVVALALAVLPAGRASAENTAARKLGRGLAAMTCGFLEVPGHIVQMTRERGPGWGFSLGFVQGLGGIVVRELVGVYEFVTAPFPLPAGFNPIIEPEFPWGYFDEQPAPHH
jgi:putative exosortase-associated protein (TIGR04073 family)